MANVINFAEEALKRGGNRVVKEATEEMSEKASKIVRSRSQGVIRKLDPEDVARNELIKKNRQRASELRTRHGSINTSRVDGVTKNSNIDLSDLEMHRERNRQRNLGNVINTDSSNFSNTEQGRQINEIRNRADRVRNGEISQPRKRGDFIPNSSQINNWENDQIANTSIFSSSSYDDYAKKNKVDNSYLLKKEKQANLKSKIVDQSSSINKKKVNNSADEAKKLFSKSNIQKGVGLGVGGYLVFNMFDKGGQMSNAELYGQQQQYGSY